jgi:hypothetical protein
MIGYAQRFYCCVIADYITFPTEIFQWERGEMYSDTDTD